MSGKCDWRDMSPARLLTEVGIDRLLGHNKIDIRECVEDKGRIHDSTKKYFIEGDRSQYVLLVAAAVNPLLVQRNVEKSLLFRSYGHPLGGVISRPIHHGLCAGRSWALFAREFEIPAHRPLASIQKRVLVRPIATWLKQKLMLTKHLINEEERDLLQRNVNEFKKIFHDTDSISELFSRFDLRDVKVYRVFSHNDLWKGNILLRKRRMFCLTTNFFVIDWAGADENGFPFYDLLRFSESFGVSDRRTMALIKEWCHELECDQAFSMIYLILGLSTLHANLEYFPYDLFKELSIRLMHKLNSLLLLAGC